MLRLRVAFVYLIGIAYSRMIPAEFDSSMDDYRDGEPNNILIESFRPGSRDAGRFLASSQEYTFNVGFLSIFEVGVYALLYMTF